MKRNAVSLCVSFAFVFQDWLHISWWVILFPLFSTKSGMRDFILFA